MNFPLLNSAILQRRYKLFLADVQQANGLSLTLHCPNTGAMTGCANQGDRVWFSTHDNPKRKYPHTWELTETAQNELICVNTQRANTLVAEALNAGVISELADYSQILAEQKYGAENSRIDFLLKGAGLPDCFVEVKSTTLLAENGLGLFPDTQTERGQKHLRELMQIAKQGQRAVVLFAALHSGIQQFDVAAHIDPIYGKLFEQAKQVGVEMLCYQAEFERQGGIPVSVRLTKWIEVI